MEQIESLPKVEIKLFEEIIDGKGYKHLVANPNHPNNCAQKGVIRIEALRRSNIKMPRTSFSVITDPTTGITYGVPMGIDKESGNLMFKRIIIGQYAEYNLANPTDRAIWCAFSRSTILLGSPFQKAKPLYRKEDKEADAEKVLKETNDLIRAVKLAQDINGIEFFDMATSLGLSPSLNSPNVLRSLLIQNAKTNPTKFVETFDNSNRLIINVFNRCRSVGLIESTIDQGWMWKKSYPLGMSEAAAVGTMAKNPALTNQMDLESKQRSTSLLNYAKPEEIASSGFTVSHDENFGKTEQDYLSEAELKRETAKTKEAREELLKGLSDVAAMKSQMQALIDANKPKVTLEELQDEAFELGWAKARTCEDEAELKKQIKARKK